MNKNGFVFVKCVGVMCGLPHAGIIAQEFLEERLEEHGYHQSKTTSGLWTHETQPINLTLIVDVFWVKYVGAEHANHLISVLEQHYKVSKDWRGKRYGGITLN